MQGHSTHSGTTGELIVGVAPQVDAGQRKLSCFTCLWEASIRRTSGLVWKQNQVTAFKKESPVDSSYFVKLPTSTVGKMRLYFINEGRREGEEEQVQSIPVIPSISVRTEGLGPCVCYICPMLSGPPSLLKHSTSRFIPLIAWMCMYMHLCLLFLQSKANPVQVRTVLVLAPMPMPGMGHVVLHVISPNVWTSAGVS